VAAPEKEAEEAEEEAVEVQRMCCFEKREEVDEAGARRGLSAGAQAE